MEIQWLEVLKWIGIALAAGFIGYFGRYFAMLIIDRMHKRQPQDTPTNETKEAPGQASTLEESRLKLEKKKAKAEVKRTKKEGEK